MSRLRYIAVVFLAAVIALGGAASANAAVDSAGGARSKPLKATGAILPGWQLRSTTSNSSTHVFGKSRASGGYRIAWLYVESKLYRKRWYGWQHRDTDKKLDTNTRGLAAIALTRCGGKYTYRTRGWSKAKHRGKTYSAITRHDKRLRC